MKKRTASCTRYLILLACAQFCCLLVPSTATIVAKSSITRCSGSGDLHARKGTPCEKMLVVALTIKGDEGKSQYLQADVSKVVDGSNPKKMKNVQLKYPLRIRVTKSPVLIHFDMFKVATFSHFVEETIVKKSKCRSDWYAKNRQLGCPRLYTAANQKIFDSQGICCSCDRKSSRFDRATSVKTKGYYNCAGHKRAKMAHCMKKSPLLDHAYELKPPRLVFTIEVAIEQQEYTHDDKPLWKRVSTIRLGPHRRVGKSSSFEVKAEYIADFHPDTFTKVASLSSKYVVLPDIEDIRVKAKKDPKVWEYLRKTQQIAFLNDPKEWLAVDQTLVTLPGGGNSCNKMGVTYADFRYMPDFCSNKAGSCLKNQAYRLWEEDVWRVAFNKAPRYMLKGFGKLHSVTKRDFSLPTGHVTFIADRPQKSLVVVSLAADNLKIITHKSPGRIVEAYIDSFEALAETGTLMVILQNIGSITATYQVFVVKCSAGIDFIPSDMTTLDPQETLNITFDIHSVYTIGKINQCEVELNNGDGELLDNMTVYFETEDTCFCYGHCGCACGNDTGTCPPTPTYHKNDTFIDIDAKLKVLKKVRDFMVGNVGKFMLVTWFFHLLVCLGCLKVVHMFLTGQIDYPAITTPISMTTKKVHEIQKKVCQKWFPQIYDCVTGTCERCCLCCCALFMERVTGKEHTETATDMSVYERGWLRPRQCNGMCPGARQARQLHRKQMRINKRKGMKNETAWYQKKYNCNCKVSETMPCCDICKGLFFFFYLPTLPLWWTLDFVWSFIRRKCNRHKRKKRYREVKARQAAKEEEYYLSVDQYTRGTVEKQILEVDRLNKAKKTRQLQKVNEGFDAENQTDKDTDTSEYESSDTSDEEQAGEIDELLSPGYPVFFNYASVLPHKAPSSLKTPGRNFSIKGKLTEQDGAYIFELFKYTHQVKYTYSEKVKVLKPARALDRGQFKRKLNSAETALKLVSLAPLFTALNDEPKCK